MRKLLSLAMLVIFTLPAFAQENGTSKEDTYTKTITARAEKIVSGLQLTDSVQMKRVVATLTNQYRRLNSIYNERDARIAAVKQLDQEKQISDSLVKSIEELYWNKARKFHEPFISELSKELNKEQIDRVKDAMTYNVLNVTYKAFTEMIPSLKESEKDQIRMWLAEAREYAMDAESSEKKHWWFGKYKGKINNYLSGRGYDLQKERTDWEQRTKQKMEKKSQ
jgi:hypothetical protein